MATRVKRELKRSLKTIHLWGIAVGLVISGEYFGCRDDAVTAPRCAPLAARYTESAAVSPGTSAMIPCVLHDGPA